MADQVRNGIIAEAFTEDDGECSIEYRHGVITEVNY